MRVADEKDKRQKKVSFFRRVSETHTHCVESPAQRFGGCGVLSQNSLLLVSHFAPHKPEWDELLVVFTLLGDISGREPDLI